MTRYVTFRFDDGYIAGARTAVELLKPSHASFFIITGPIERTICLSEYPHFSKSKYADYGDLNAWKCLADNGSDIQPHSETHRKFTEISREEQEVEIRKSLEFVRKIHDGPYIFCYPFNDVPTSRPNVKELSACGFHTVDPPHGAAANQITTSLDLYGLQSWSVTRSNFELILKNLAVNVPDDTWVILGLHSLNGEGYEPLTSEQLSKLICAARQGGFQVVTVAEIVRSLLGKSDSK